MRQPIETTVEGVNRGCRVSSVSGCEATTFNEAGRDMSLLTKYRALPPATRQRLPASTGRVGVLRCAILALASAPPLRYGFRMDRSNSRCRVWTCWKRCINAGAGRGICPTRNVCDASADDRDSVVAHPRPSGCVSGTFARDAGAVKHKGRHECLVPLRAGGRPLAGQDCPGARQAGDCASETSHQIGLV
jgi:hypothetical protein